MEWNILEKTGLCLRDNAANMVAAFDPEKVPDCKLKAAGCLNHSLQLVIKDECFALVSVESLIKKCQSLVSHANKSTKHQATINKNSLQAYKNSKNENHELIWESN